MIVEKKQKKKIRINYYLLLFLTLLLISLILVEIFVRSLTDDYFDELTITIQKNHRSKSMTKYLELCTLLGYGLPLSILCLLYFEVSKNKVNAGMLIFLTTFINYFLSIIKMIYSQPRPYMRNEEILSLYKCGKEFGDPSGHAMNGICFYFIFLNSLRKRVIYLVKFLYYKEKTKIKENQHQISSEHKNNINIEMKIKDNNNKTKEESSLTNELDLIIRKNENRDFILCPNCKNCSFPNDKIKEKKFIGKKLDEEINLCEECEKVKKNEASPEYEKKNDSKSNSKNLQNEIYFKIFIQFINFLFLAFWIILTLSIGYSRVYFGLHSFSQVILGWIYGLYFICLFYLFLTNEYIIQKILVFFKTLTVKTSQNELKKIKMKLFIFTTIIYFFTFFIPWIIYYVMNKDFVISEAWKLNFLKKCDQNIFNTALFYKDCFADVGSISLIIGIFYGVIFSSGNYEHLKFWDNYYQLKFYKKSLRLAIFGAIAGIIFGIFAAINFGENEYINCLVNNNIKAFLVGFFEVFLCPIIFKKFKMDVSGDFMREKNE